MRVDRLAGREQRLRPSPVERFQGCSAAPRIVSVSCGWRHTAALAADGRVFTFGELGFGRLGLGMDGREGGAGAEDGDDDAGATIDTPHAMICGLDTAAPWLAPTHMPGPESAPKPEPGLVPEPEPEPSCLPYTAVLEPAETRAMAVACGDFHTVVLLRDGRLFSCGRGECGRLGHGLPVSDQWRLRCVQALSGVRVVRVACGESHTLAAAADGAVWAFGSNRAGTLGNGSRLDGYEPSVVRGVNLHESRRRGATTDDSDCVMASSRARMAS